MDSQIRLLFNRILRQGVLFRKILKDMSTSQYFSSAQLEALHNMKLSKLVRHCYNNVPYYRELFDSLGLKPEDVSTKEGLMKLPLMDKNVVRQNYKKLKAVNIPNFLCTTAETSGTTGTPSKFLRDYQSVNFESAALWRFREAVGGNRLKTVILRGDVIVPVNQETPPFWKHYPLSQELHMSSYHILAENAGFYYDEMITFGAESIYGFPSSIYILAKFFDNIGKKLKLKAIFTSSETISDKQRECIENVFQCKIYDWYGQVERVSAIGQCEYGTYHIIDDYSITELVENGNGTEIVGTNLNNYIMPLLRYRTYDIIESMEGHCPCGRHFRIVSKILGRSQHYVILPEGKKISLFLISDAIDFADNINEIQFVHEKQGQIILNIVKNDQFSEKDRLKIIRSIKEHTSPKMDVVIHEVKNIPRGPNGKVIDVIIRL